MDHLVSPWQPTIYPTVPVSYHVTNIQVHLCLLWCKVYNIRYSWWSTTKEVMISDIDSRQGYQLNPSTSFLSWPDDQGYFLLPLRLPFRVTVREPEAELPSGWPCTGRPCSGLPWCSGLPCTGLPCFGLPCFLLLDTGWLRSGLPCIRATGDIGLQTPVNCWSGEQFLSGRKK